MKPDFVCLGANKAGTTFFYRLLRQNPLFFKAKQKEFNLFGYSDLTKKDYENYFLSFKDKKDLIAYDLSTIYFRHAVAIEQITNLMPNMKYVIFLRHPSKRAISHNHFNNFLYNRKTSIEDIFNTYALKKYRFNPYLNERKKDNDYLDCETIDSSFYSKKLKKIYQFIPKENLFIVIFEEFVKDPQKTMDEFHLFLGIDPFNYENNEDKMETIQIRNEMIRKSIITIDFFLQFTPKSIKNLGLRTTKFIKRKTGKPINKEKNNLFINELNNLYKDDVKELSLLINKDVKKIWNI